MEEHYQEFVVEQEERVQQLQVQGEAVDDAAESTQAETTQSEQAPEQVSEEVRAAAMAQLQSMSGTQGFGSSSLPQNINMDPSD